MKTGKRFDFGGEISRLLPLIIREVTRKQSSVMTKGDLAIPHIVILELLKEKGPCRMGDLSRGLHLTMSAATAIVDKMVKLNLVRRERSNKDRRVVRVALLKKGQETARRIYDERRKSADNMFSMLTEPERREYLRILRKVCDSLRKKK